MKKLLCILCAAATILSLVSCFGTVEEVRVNIGPSEIYSEKEIDDAVYTVLHYFKREFGGCSLTRLDYIEEENIDAAGQWAAQYDADQAIVLISSFEVTGKTDGSLARGETYSNWQWILARNGDGEWRVETCGY